MATKMRPSHYPDFHAVGRSTGTEADLQGQEFLTHCPPDLPPRHRILALLGPTDKEDAASPNNDGWFVSDFYLFFNILAPTTPRQPPNQIWLTSENPAALVQKYTEYLHGDSTGERRVVLDQQMLPDIAKSERLRIVSRGALLERFINTLREQATEVAQTGEHLVLLIFGHGNLDHGVEVADGILRMSDLRRLLQQTPNVTVFTTSCYSGGWLVVPDIRGGHLNTTAITAAGPDSESSSWPGSESVGRASGSLATTGILRCLMETEADQMRAYEESYAGGDDESEPWNHESDIRHTMDHPTYIQFAKSVYESVKDMGLLGREQEILYFSAQNDEWELSYKPRLGLPLTFYQEKWQALRKVDPSSSTSSGVPLHMMASRTGASGRSVKRLKYLTEEYFASFPGHDCLAGNLSLHGDLRKVLEGKAPSHKVDDLIEITAYRLGSMHEADYLRQEVGLRYPSVFEIDAGRILGSLPHTTMDLRLKTWHLLLKYDINTTPIGIKRPWGKPLQYLTLALVETSSSWEVIESRIEEMARKKKAWFRFIFRAWQGQRVAHDENVRVSQRAFFEAFKKLR